MGDFNPRISVDDLKRLVSYDPSTGIIVRRTRAGNQRAGSLGRYKDTYGYLRVKLQGRQYRCHAIAVALMTGGFADSDIDHINGDRSDNRWANLRVCDRSSNLRNAALRKDNKTGIHGVHWDSSMAKWVSSIRDSDGRKHRKTFHCLLDAAAWRKSKETIHGYHEGHGRRQSVVGGLHK